ncbi:hypothetical protein DCCM_3584 [Desulfocucumis palustris]|uniref:Uncharacterized protein n=1 Tax=Desulfocucumis palustris TaxID=1898651 RepID=A0A2L2XJM2_9FIRM|nr:hypothetical protein DCCM_3584 [Desulfocucumis palustris]
MDPLSTTFPHLFYINTSNPLTAIKKIKMSLWNYFNSRQGDGHPGLIKPFFLSNSQGNIFLQVNRTSCFQSSGLKG